MVEETANVATTEASQEPSAPQDQPTPAATPDPPAAERAQDDGGITAQIADLLDKKARLEQDLRSQRERRHAAEAQAETLRSDLAAARDRAQRVLEIAAVAGADTSMVLDSKSASERIFSGEDIGTVVAEWRAAHKPQTPPTVSAALKAGSAPAGPASTTDIGALIRQSLKGT